MDRIMRGDVTSAARLMRDLDDDIPSARNTIKDLYSHTGRAHILGITGTPGGGKSTLVDCLTKQFRKAGKTVGIIAIDPSSPFSGGAILGDRIRMQAHSLDGGVFIKSLATRGHYGGLSRSTIDIMNVMDAMGKDVIIIETVGVGQDETEIVKVAHTNMVVLVPGLGDDIQAIKAGILEIADIFVINKADREGADRTGREIEYMVEMKEYSDNAWKPKIVKTVAIRDEGIENLLSLIDEHGLFVETHDEREIHNMRKAKVELMEILKSRLLEEAVADLQREGLFDEIVENIANKKMDPYSIVDRIVDHKFAFHIKNDRGKGKK